MSKTRIYRITNRLTNAAHLVRAPSPAAAIRHVAEDMLSASVATQDDLVALLVTGAKVETAGEESPEAEVA